MKEVELVSGDTWEELIDNIENKTKFGVDLEFRDSYCSKIHLIDVHGNIFFADVITCVDNSYVIDMLAVSRDKSCHH